MSSEMAPCPKCRQLNSAASEECLFCDAPLPWSTNPAHLAAAAGAPYGASPIADPTGNGPVMMPRKYGYAEFADRYELWITVVSLLIPLAGVYFFSKYVGNSPLRARSALFGLLPTFALIVFTVLLQLFHSAATVGVRAPIGTH